MEAQRAAPLLVFPQLNGELNPRLIRPYKLSILNGFHLSIELALRLYLFVLRLNVVIMNFCMIDCFIVVCLHGGE